MAKDIRGVLVPSKDVKVWLLGKVHWRGWSIPLISYSGLVHGSLEEIGPQTRIAVIKSINHIDELPYIAIINDGVPRLQTITQGDLQAHETKAEDHPGMAFRVTIHDELAEIPDMQEIERHVLDALQQEQTDSDEVSET